jgi:hypothetical protein
MKTLLASGAVVALLLTAPPAHAGQVQQTAANAVDARWLPWLGCWVPAGGRSTEDDVQICVTPAGSTGVQILTRAGDKTVFEETIVADGQDQRVDEASCRGTRRAEWSGDGQRLFSTGKLSCDKEDPRTISGLTALTTNAEWIDVQVVTAGTRESVRVRRYRRSPMMRDPSLIQPELETLAHSRALGTRLTIDHVIEASRKVTPRVLEALLFETKATFPLDRRRLIALDDAAVADTVIDLMVAYSFPKKFEVRRSAGGGGFSSFGPDWSGLGWGGFGLSAEYAWPWFSNPFYSYYSPFGYAGLNYWDTYYSPGAYAGSSESGGTAVQPASHGRVINGSGYTQVVTRAPENDGQATTRVRGTDASDGGFSGTSSGGSSGVSSGGYSSGGGSGGGGGGGDSGRTAVPR